jgi:hypothetical protein
MLKLNPQEATTRSKRPRLPARSVEELYRLPAHALVTAPEASLVTRLTESALAVRRSKGQWPPYVKIDGLVRYTLEALLGPAANDAGAP